MSLINDALKKAQKLQNQQPPASVSPASPAAGTPVAPTVIRRGKPIGFETMLLGLVAAVVVIVGITVVAVLIFRREGRPAVAVAPHATPPGAVAPFSPAPKTPDATASAAANEPAAATVAEAATKPAPVATATASPPTAAPVPPPTQPPANETPVPPAVSQAPANPPPAAVAVSAPAAPVATPAVESPAPSVSVQVNPATPPPIVTEPPPAAVAKTEPPAAAQPSPPAAPQQNRKILVYIDGLKVTGVRAAGTDSKVLMNDRVYRVNDMVDYELGLRLTIVTTSGLTFVDDNGVVYTKTF